MNTDNATAHASKNYDVQIRQTIPYYNAFHQQSIELVSVYNPHPHIWIDTGCGTGTLVLKCLPVFPHTQFVLADPSAQMLEIAKEKLSSYAPQVSLLSPVKTQNLSLNQKADVITAVQSHHYLSRVERKQAVENCYDLLANAGIFIVFENISPESQTGIHLGKQMWGNHQIAGGKSMEEVQSHLERFGRSYYPISVAEHVALYKECGFRSVEILWYSYMQAGFYCIK